MIIVLNIIFFAMQDFAESTNKVQRRFWNTAKTKSFNSAGIASLEIFGAKKKGKISKGWTAKVYENSSIQNLFKKISKVTRLLHNAKKPIGKIGVGSRVKNLCKWK